MSSPPKKMRKSGGGVTTVNAQNDTAQNPNDEIQMDEDLDPASMYEDEEGNEQKHHNISYESNLT